MTLTRPGSTFDPFLRGDCLPDLDDLSPLAWREVALLNALLEHLYRRFPIVYALRHLILKEAGALLRLENDGRNLSSPRTGPARDASGPPSP